MPLLRIKAKYLEPQAVEKTGMEFTYHISQNGDGAELLISRRSKSISRSSILLAYKRVKEMFHVSAPKSIGVYVNVKPEACRQYTSGPVTL